MLLPEIVDYIIGVFWVVGEGIDEIAIGEEDPLDFIAWKEERRACAEYHMVI